MSDYREYSLEPIRTDGWFERIGESVGSFDALCEILGEEFFAFSLITGARITALNVDRQNPGASVVEFEVGGGQDDPVEARKLTLDRFRQRLVAALVADEVPAPPPARETDTEAIQMHVGVRYLLLAPIFGYALNALRCYPTHSELSVARDGVDRLFELEEFHELLRSHVIEELDRVSDRESGEQGGIDLGRIAEVEAASEQGDYNQVLSLIGSWAAPLSVLLRTPDGRMLNADTKSKLSLALRLLGNALFHLGDGEQAEDVLRLAVQYGVDTPGGGAAYARLGAHLLAVGRAGEAIAPLRRAANARAEPGEVWPQLGIAFLERGRLLAALGAVEEGLSQGAEDPRLQSIRSQVFERLPALQKWEELKRGDG